MKVRLLLSLFLLSVSTSLFSISITQLDSFPILDVIEEVIIDTVTIFDYDTGEEKVTVVRNVGEYVAIFDTTVTFNYNTYERPEQTKDFGLPHDERKQNPDRGS